MSKHIKQEGCLIYDENERTLEPSIINESTEFIPLVHIEGIKFSSKSFQIEINVRQIMIMSLEDNIKKNCLIKNSNPNDLEKEENKSLETLDNINSIDIVEKKDNLEKEQESEEQELQEPEQENNLVIENSNNNNAVDNLEETDITVLSNEKDNLSEINLDIQSISADDKISLKKPNEVYYEIYKAAYDKAKQIKKAAIEAYLEAKKIKVKYNLDDIIQSDDEFDGFSEIED